MMAESLDQTKHEDLGFESLLSCVICLCDFTDPRVLPCLHTMCLSCLQKHVDSTSIHGQVSCPCCRDEYRIPKNGPSGFPKNFFVNTLKDILEKGPDNQKRDPSTWKTTKTLPRDFADGLSNKTCFNAGHGEADTYCKDCAVYLCNDCSKAHVLFPGARNHHLVGVDLLGEDSLSGEHAEKLTPKCQSHPSQEVDVYCEACRVLVCSSCRAEAHHQHPLKSSASAKEDFSKELDLVTKSCSDIAQTLRNASGDLDAKETQIKSEADQASREVTRAAQVLRRMVDQYEVQLQGTISEKREDALIDVAAARKELDLSESTIQSLKSYAEGLLSRGDWTDQAVHLPGLKERLQQHQQPKTQATDIAWNCSIKKGDSRDVSVEDCFDSLLKVSFAKEKDFEDDEEVASIEDKLANFWWGCGRGPGRHGRGRHLMHGRGHPPPPPPPPEFGHHPHRPPHPWDHGHPGHPWGHGHRGRRMRRWLERMGVFDNQNSDSLPK